VAGEMKRLLVITSLLVLTSFSLAVPVKEDKEATHNEAAEVRIIH